MIVLDTSFLVAFCNRGDVHHERASALMERFFAEEWGEGLLLEYVFLELVTVLQIRVGLEAALAAGDTLLGAEELVFVPCSDLFLPALEVFRSQGERALSFADAALVAAARREDPALVATFDRGFDGVSGIRTVG